MTNSTNKNQNFHLEVSIWDCSKKGEDEESIDYFLGHYETKEESVSMFYQLHDIVYPELKND
jgi:hypothetical protein